MWNNIVSSYDIEKLMNTMCFFHDSCIKEMKYLSGAYVENDLSMYPINDQRVLRVIVQRQYKDPSAIEMEFIGLKSLKLAPTDEDYTCEILDATMIISNDSVYWCDCGGLLEKDCADYEGTVICASRVRWRAMDIYIGKNEVYIAQ